MWNESNPEGVVERVEVRSQVLVIGGELLRMPEETDDASAEVRSGVVVARACEVGQGSRGGFYGVCLNRVVLVSDTFLIASGNWDDVHRGGVSSQQEMVSLVFSILNLEPRSAKLLQPPCRRRVQADRSRDIVDPSRLVLQR